MGEIERIIGELDPDKLCCQNCNYYITLNNAKLVCNDLESVEILCGDCFKAFNDMAYGGSKVNSLKLIRDSRRDNKVDDIIDELEHKKKKCIDCGEYRELSWFNGGKLDTCYMCVAKKVDEWDDKLSKNQPN